LRSRHRRNRVSLAPGLSANRSCDADYALIVTVYGYFPPAATPSVRRVGRRPHSLEPGSSTLSRSPVPSPLRLTVVTLAPRVRTLRDILAKYGRISVLSCATNNPLIRLAQETGPKILRPQCRLPDSRQTIGLFVGRCPTSRPSRQRKQATASGWKPVLRGHTSGRPGCAVNGHSTRYDLTTGPSVC